MVSIYITFGFVHTTNRAWQWCGISIPSAETEAWLFDNKRTKARFYSLIQNRSTTELLLLIAPMSNPAFANTFVGCSIFLLIILYTKVNLVGTFNIPKLSFCDYCSPSC